MKDYSVTIAIPVYNAEKYIAKSLQAALDQTFGDIEILLIDDCGTDGSLAIVESMRTSSERGHCISVYRNAHNMGVAGARNAAIDIAKGKYIYFFDSDDYIPADTIEKMYGAAVAADADLVTGSYRDIIDAGHYVDNIEQAKSFSRPGEFARYVFGSYTGVSVGPWNKLIRTQMLRDNRLYFPELRISEDVPFSFLLFSRAQKVVCLPDITYHYIIHEGTICQYNPRDVIPVDEIKWHIKSRMMLKDIASQCKDEDFFPLMVSAAMGYCFSLAGVIVRKKKIISEQIPYEVLSQLIAYPIQWSELKKHPDVFKKNKWRYAISKLPFWCFDSYITWRKRLWR